MRKGIDCKGKEWEEFDMSKSLAKDITGQKFGRLTAQFRVQNTKTGDAQWLTTCECGNEVVVRASGLKSGHSKSCGCYQKDAVSTKLAKSFEIGEQIGYWTIMYRSDEYVGKGAYWHCICKCGTERDVKAEHLRNKVSLSCGCLNRELNSERQLIDLIGERFGLLEVIKKSDKKTSYGDIYWQCRCDCGNIQDISGHNLRRGSVLSCGCLNMSHGEYHISNTLHSNNIDFVYNRGYFEDLRNDDGKLLRYDFILLNNNIPYRIIEFDGKQHDEPVGFFGGEDSFIKLQRNDEIKNQYAKSHDIPLVRIPYSKRNNINLEDLLGDKYLI